MKCGICFCLLFIFSGCASIQVSNRQAELKAQMDPLLGKTKDDLIFVLGAPGETMAVGGFEVYKYYWSYGSRTRVTVSQNKYYHQGRANARTWETYDTINAYFKDGIMVRWDGYVQR